MSEKRFSDEDLTAFLDGEADPALNAEITQALNSDEALAERLASLDIPIAAIRSSYDALLSEAPDLPVEDASPTKTKASRVPWTLGTFATGLAAGIAIAFLLPKDSTTLPEPGWKAVVASYQSLYGADTLNSVDPNSAETSAQLERVSASIGLDLENLPAPSGLTFKRAQLLSFNGRPLAQLAYQRADGTPVALCILKVDSADATPMSVETMVGLGAASWNAGGFGYLLIGGDTSQAIEPEAVPFMRWSQAAT